MPKPEAIMELQPYNDNLRMVRGVEIFRAGEWNGDDYSVADLDEMVQAFGDQGYAVPLKLGHGETQGMPAYGWLDRVYRIGETLKADFRDVPVWVFDMVFIQHSYDHVSIEIYFNLKRDGKTYKRALKAVALLGAETPAVSGLAPLRDAIFAPAADTFEKQVAYTLQVAPMPDPVVKPEPKVVVPPVADPTVVAQMAAQAETIAALTKQVKDAADASTALLATVATLTKTQQDATAAAKVAALRLPALTEHFRHLYALAGAKVVKFKAVDGKEVDQSIEAILDEVIAHVNKFADPLTRTALPRGKAQPGTLQATADAGEELAVAVTAHMSEKGLKNTVEAYEAATRAVLTAKPDLAQRYAEFARGVN